MITSLFGPLGAPGPLGLFAPDLNRLYQRHWGLEGSRKAKKWRRHTPDCSSQLTSHSLSPLWVSREAKAAIQAPSPLWYKKIAQIQASTGPEINFLTKPRPIPAFPPMGLGVSTKKRGFCDNFFRVKIVWTPLTNPLSGRSPFFPGTRKFLAYPLLAEVGTEGGSRSRNKGGTPPVPGKKGVRTLPCCGFTPRTGFRF